MDSRRNGRRSGRRRRRERSPAPANQESDSAGSSSTGSSNPPTSAGGAPSIPGFYFDEERGRYFRILPEHLAAGNTGFVTPNSIRQRDRESQRQSLLSDANRQRIPEVKRRATSGSVTGMLGNLELGLVGREQFRREVMESRVRYGDVGQVGDKKLSDFDSFMLHRVDFLDVTPDGKTIFGWGDQGEGGFKIMFGVDVKKYRGTPFEVGLTESRFHFPDAERYLSDRYTDMMYVRAGGLDMILFSTFTPALDPFCGSMLGYSFLTWPEAGSRPVTRRDHCKGMDEIIWSCAATRNLLISVGLEGRASIIDRHDLFSYQSVGKIIATGEKDPLVQRFSEDENQLFMGLRASVIKSYDMRTLRPVYSLKQSTVSSLHVMQQDPNYILAGNFSGEIQLWDLRMRKAVRNFDGQVNTHTKLPLIVNEEDNLVFSGGEDGTVRCWSLRTGEKLREIASPYPVNEIKDIPAYCYSNRWGGKPGNSAILLGVKDELHFYKI